MQAPYNNNHNNLLVFFKSKRVFVMIALLVAMIGMYLLLFRKAEAEQKCVYTIDENKTIQKLIDRINVLQDELVDLKEEKKTKKIQGLDINMSEKPWGLKKNFCYPK